MRKDTIDAAGAVALVAFSVSLGVNQVVIKLVNAGLQPAFNAGLRSVLALGLLLIWVALRRVPLRTDPAARPFGLLIGAIFGFEFLFVFWALDLTSVARVSVIFYTMPVWLALLAHWFIPGERLTLRAVVGQGLAVAGIAWAVLDRGAAEGALAGDLLALLGAFGWALIALCTKISPFARVRPEVQLIWQVAVSAPILLLAAWLTGPLVRDFVPAHLWGVGFQALLVAGGFLGWFALLKIYPAAGVASFAFLSPVFGVLLGWLVLGEAIGPSVWGALVLVALGLTLINWREHRGALKNKGA